jgi:hypothetical protein
MSKKRLHRKIERTPEEQRELEEIRERFQRERPGLEDLLATGDATEVYENIGDVLEDERLQQSNNRFVSPESGGCMTRGAGIG